VTARRRRRSAWHLSRDTILFAVGIGLTIYEALGHRGPERPALLVLYAAMMGLPFVLRADELRRQMNREE
jgi:hypothetical protein